ncbi:integrator complex subunit 4 [Oncorhynchus nerka]|uniref:integrator complex subunit 4 n=1 Tax=Oncorhynchus nerka TaxID=8023 RepID=UPI000D0A0802|nr:integrator complex subunit 4 isoform X2 [Oncorhynchus tshawytscha]XP_029502761.1 integrator complex subunit 4 [Oncorhynchus nerka]XP_046169621.1 integrator complex subunit 4 isoform X1 [Oncorhynchus gorbuscha]
MAAHLKKRVYEEFSKVVQLPQEEAPAKKLRLTKPSKSAALHIDLCKASNPTDALQYLLHFARSSVEAESVEGVVRILLEHYYKEQDNSVRLKIASLIGLLSKTQNFNPESILDDTLNTFNTEKSHQVLAQLLDTLLVIGTQLPESLIVRHRLIEVAYKHLSDTYFGVRNKCLQLLGCLGNVDTPLNKDGQGLVPAVIGGSAPGVSGGVCVRDAQSLISDYFADQDPRVRTAAIKAMLQLHERGLKIQQTIYDQACQLLCDDYEQVRSAAVQMVWVLSQLYPESIVPIPSSNEQVRLVDDSFGKISHMVSDGSWVVRVQAAKTLGNMLQVSPHFLEQTLDKKLMSDLRRKRTAHERAKELYASGEFSSGRKWADDAPKEKVDTSAVNLIASGACGAFVHGLEDEMYEVRIAAVDALSALAQSSASFAEKCLDFLVDMFNDEIEEVRLQSIHVLRQISTNITLREDQLDTVLAVLEDSSRDIREALHELLCFTNVSTKECIQLALLELLKNLTKYPTDRNSVWKCLKFLGCRHPTLVLPLVPELLSTHPYFHTPEPDMDDPAYIAVLVLVFNAAQSCPTMTALFSDHTFRHYTYLRDSLSHLVPPLRLPGRTQAPGVSGIEGSGSVESAQLFLQQSLSRISTIHNLQDPGAQDLLNFTIRDLQRLGELQTELAGAADFSATYLRCQLLLTKALQEKLWTMAVPLCLKHNAMATAAAKQMLEETYKLEFLYSGLENRQVATIHHVRLQAKALQLVLTARTRRGVEPLISVCEKFLQEVESFQRLFVVELPHLQESFVGKLLDLSPKLSACKPGELVKILQTTLRQSGFLNLQLPKQVQRASATIIEPTGESDNPLRFTSGLVVALDIDATLEHVQDPHNTVKVQVLYPDGQSHVIQPKPGDFRSPGPHRHRLITQVYLSHSAWTEACQIEVRLLLAYSSSRLCKAVWSDSSTEGLQPAEGATEGTIPFGKPVKVFIMPKPARR